PPVRRARAGDHGIRRSEDRTRRGLFEIRAEESAARPDHHGPTERAVDPGRRLINLERVRKAELEAVVAEWNPQPEQAVLHERAHDVVGQREAAVRLRGVIADEPADSVEPVEETLCGIVGRHARDHSFGPLRGDVGAASRDTTSTEAIAACGPRPPSRAPRGSRRSPLWISGLSEARLPV